MPIFWWYLLRNYLKVFLLSVLSFIAILLVARLEEIAQFSTFGAQGKYLALFTLYQIPYVLPIAIPISSLISAILLFQRLSHSYELTALRAGGIGLTQIIAPILWAGTLLAIATFYITSEIATSSHLATRKMAYDLCSANPLLLLQGAKIARLKQGFVQMDPIHQGQVIENLVIAIKNPSSQHLNLCLIDRIDLIDERKTFLAKNVTVISTLSSTNQTSGCPCVERDHLLIENQHHMQAPASQLALLLRKSGWRIANDHLKLSLLRIRLNEIASKRVKGEKISPLYRKGQSEIIRRLSFGLAPLTFTVMGLALGMEISRNRSRKGIYLALILTAFCLISFCIGKSMEAQIGIALSCYLIPHLILTSIAWRSLNRINRGIE